MNFKKYLAALGMVLGLAACGGGGGSAGSQIGSPSGTASAPATTTTPVSLPTMDLSVVDSAGVVLTTHTLSQTDKQFLKVVLKSSAGAAVAFERVKVTLDTTESVLVPTNGAQLTDTSGVVMMRIMPASVSSSGVVRATATATVESTALTKTYDLSISPGTVGLSAVTVTPTTVQKGQSINVSVDVTVNGATAASNSLSVAFNTDCGTISPASALVNSLGKATAVIQTTATGNCKVEASANGVTTPSTGYTVALPPKTGIQFVSATPTLLRQVGSTGATTSIVIFKVIDAVGVGVQGVSVNATLTNTDGGISFCGAPSSGNTAADGTVSFSICSGTLPATVQVRAELVDTPTIFTNSNLLTIQTGLPTQRFFDISATQLNFYAGGHFTSQFNGNSTSISVFAADRQGNPVPDGTKIIFVSEGGQINSGGVSSCLITAGRCSVDLIGQDYRPLGSSAPLGDPRPGRVTVLAYTDGEESFTDANFNNRYDKKGDLVNGVTVAADELFEDLGTLYMDKDESGSFLAAYTNLVTGTNDGEFSYPMPVGSTGGIACPTNSAVGLSVAGTCNNKWDGLTKVRRQIVIVFSGGEIGQPSGYHSSIPVNKRTATLSASTSAVAVRLADYNGNPLPASATLSTQIFPASSACTATISGTQIGSTTEPTVHVALLDQCVGGELLQFKVSVAGGLSAIESAYSVTIPAPTPDTTAPTFTTAPAVESVTSSGALLSATLNEAGTGYYKVQLASEVSPSVFAVTFTGSALGMNGNIPAGALLSGLIANTNYSVYFVAKDKTGNTQASVTKVSFTTLP